MKAINVLVAEKVMGWKVYSTNNAGLVLMDEAMARDWGPTGVGLATQAELDAKKYIKTTYVPEYSTSIEAAWEVARSVCKVPDDKWFFEYTKGHTLAVFRPSQCRDVHAKQFEAVSPSFEVAICLAALRSKAVPESEITAAMEAK